MVSITRQTLTDEIRRQQQLAQEITKGQIAVSSGNKYSAPSDNIQSWVQIYEIGKMQASYSAWTGNIEYGKSRSAKAENSLDGVNNLMTRAQEDRQSTRLNYSH